MARRRPHRLGDGPIEPRYRQRMETVAHAIDAFLNGDAKGNDRQHGFVLLMFPFGDDPKGRCNFVSNGADRRDIVSLFKEMIARFEGQPEPPTGRA